MAQERKAAQESAAKQKKSKKNGIMVDEGHVPTAEELRLRHMRAGRFGKGAVDHSVPAKGHAPVYAVRVFSHLAPLFTYACKIEGFNKPYPHNHSSHLKLCFSLSCWPVGTALRHALNNGLLLNPNHAAGNHRHLSLVTCHMHQQLQAYSQ